jgi:alpha 1,6-mannosyltransferase
MAVGPYHPIMLSALLRVVQNTAMAIDWAQLHYTNYTTILADVEADKEAMDADAEREAWLDRLEHLDILTEPRDGGPLGVIGWTGPSVFTDSVLSYLLARYGMTWRDLKDLRRPLRVGDVVILPVTGFSPGVGNFGSGNIHGGLTIHGDIS